MKNKLLTLIIILLATGFTMTSQTVKAEDGGIEGAGEIYILRKIDTNKKVLTLADIKIAYNSATIFSDSNGNKKSLNDLKLGQVISYEYNYSARYYSMPIATKIVIML